MYVSRAYRILRSSCYSVPTAFRVAQRSAHQNSEDEANREANALGLLAQTPCVHLKTECYHKISNHLASVAVPKTSGFVEVSSNDLKKLVKDRNIILAIVDENSKPPLLEVSYRPVRLSNSARKLGIQADKGERTKTIQIRSNIDDHMLNVRVKQVEAFVNADHTTTIIIRLPKIASASQKRTTNKLNQINIQQDENENLHLAQAKYLAQLVIAGARVLGRAFTQALKEEYAASQQAARARRSSGNSGDNDSSRTFSQIAGISLEEAKQILNIKDIHDSETLKKHYDHLFSINAKDKGGSLYLQSKVFRAKERIDEEIHLENIERNRKKTSDENSSDTT